MPALFDTAELKPETIQQLVADALAFQHQTQRPRYPNHCLATLFLEPSTRTRLSFELAAHHLGMLAKHIDPEASALAKGETIADTLMTLDSLGINVVAIRSKAVLPIENYALTYPRLTLINAGMGARAHPTQALGDLVTMVRHFGNQLEDKKLVIVGDIKHSRVASSLITLMQQVGLTQIMLCAPAYFMPQDNSHLCREAKLDTAIDGADMVYLLRPQRERFDTHYPLQDYIQDYQLQPHHLARLNRHGILLHPGPVNRDLELCPQILSHPRCLIASQVQTGLWMRMALIHHLLSHQQHADT